MELQLEALAAAGIEHDAADARLAGDRARRGRGVAAARRRRGGGGGRRRAASSAPTVVHAHNMQPLFGPRALAAAREAGARVVLHLHNFRLFCAIAVAFRDGEPCFRCRGRFTLPGLALNCRGSLPESAVYAAALAAHQPAVLEAVDRFVTAERATPPGQLARLGLPRERIERAAQLPAARACSRGLACRPRALRARDRPPLARRRAWRSRSRPRRSCRGAAEGGGRRAAGGRARGRSSSAGRAGGAARPGAARRARAAARRRGDGARALGRARDVRRSPRSRRWPRGCRWSPPAPARCPRWWAPSAACRARDPPALAAAMQELWARPRRRGAGGRGAARPRPRALRARAVHREPARAVSVARGLTAARRR